MNNRQTFILLVSIFICAGLFSQTSTIGNSLKKNVEILASDSFEGRGFKCSSKALTIDFLTREFAEAGFAPLHGSYQQKFMDFSYLAAAEGTNIIGVIEGTDSILKNEYIVLGAHYDHLGWNMDDSVKVIFNGADDNASGVATMIETGKKLLLNRSQLKRSVLLIAFDGEEAGLKGSKDFVDKKVVDLSKIKVMFSLDMVGMYKKNDGLNIVGLYSLENGTNLFADPLNRSGLKVKKTKNSIERRTDTKSFGDKQIPAIHITTGLLSPYHKPEDDSDSLDYKGMSRIADLVSDYCIVLSNEDSLMASNAFATTKDEANDAKSKTNKSIFSIGYDLGAGSNYHFYKNAFFNAKPVFAFEGGLSSQLKITKNFILQTEINYEYLGSESVFGTMRTHSIVPAMDLVFTTDNKRKDGTFFFLSAGGFYRYNFAGSTDVKNMSVFSAYNHDEFGVKYGVGFQLKKFQINFHSKLGLTPIDKSLPNSGVFNRGKYISIVRFF